MLPDEKRRAQELQAEFDARLKYWLQRAAELYDDQAVKYDDKSEPVWHRFPFGRASFAHEVYQKAGRTVQLVRSDAELEELVEETLDLLTLAAMMLAYLDLETVTGP